MQGGTFRQSGIPLDHEGMQVFPRLKLANKKTSIEGFVGKEE